jgi:hypothetical protein
MLATQHPSDDELKLYLLDRLPGRRSLYIAEHLLLCPVCVELSAKFEDWIYCAQQELSRIQPLDGTECTTPVLVPLPMPPAVRAPGPSWHAGHAVAAAFVLSIGLSALLFQRPAGSPPVTVVPAAAVPAIAAPPVQQVADFIAPVAAPIARKRRVRAVRRPEPLVVRQFTAPPVLMRIYEPEYLLPPPEPALTEATVILAGIAPLPTDIGQLPSWPATTPKRNLFLRFLALLAKPFRSDGM